MPSQQVEHATPTRLSTISPRLVQRKLRVAGWLLHDDTESSTIMIHDGEDALLVDVALCLNAYRGSPWLREGRSVIMALGHLEISHHVLPLPVLHTHAPPVSANPHLVLRAIVVQEVRDLDMVLWNRAIQAQEEVGARTRDEAQEATRHAT